MNTKHYVLSVLATSAMAGQVYAEHADALIAVNPEGKLVTGQYDFDGGSVVNVDTRIYEGEFEGPFSNVWTTDEPGLNALSSTTPGLPTGYTTLPGSTAVTFDANAFTIGSTTANLWYWDGSGAVEFTAVTGPTVLEIAKAPRPLFSSVLDGSASDVAGFTIDTTGADGFLHKHIDFSVYNTDASAPDTGFYLWSLTFNVGTLESDPVFFVHDLGVGDEELHEAAIDYVQNTLVPEPSSATPLFAGAGLLAARRRRR